MATRLTSVGVVGKWLAVPLLLAAIGYFVLAPFALKSGAKVAPAQTENSEPASTGPDLTSAASGATALRGPDVSFSPSAYAERPKHRKHRRKPTTPKPDEAKPASDPKAPAAAPAQEPPIDTGGSGGAASGGGDATPATDSAGATGGGSTGSGTTSGTTGNGTTGNAVRPTGRQSDT